MNITKTIIGGQAVNGNGDWSTITHVVRQVKAGLETMITKLLWRGIIMREMEGQEGQHILVNLAEIWNREGYIPYAHTDTIEPDWPLWHFTNGTIFASGQKPFYDNPSHFSAHD